METGAYFAIAAVLALVGFLAFKIGQANQKKSGSGGGGGTKNPRPPKKEA